MADKPVEAVALTDSERIDRLENAVATGLNVDLGQFDTPEHQAQNKAASDQAAAAEVAQQQADAEAAAAAANPAPPADVPSADTPQDAITAAATTTDNKPDELAHLQAALAKFPDDPDILAAIADVEADIAAG